MIRFTRKFEGNINQFEMPDFFGHVRIKKVRLKGESIDHFLHRLRNLKKRRTKARLKRIQDSHPPLKYKALDCWINQAHSLTKPSLHSAPVPVAPKNDALAIPHRQIKPRIYRPHVLEGYFPCLQSADKCRFDRFWSLYAVIYTDYALLLITYPEWIYFQELPTYQGTFSQLIRLNNLTYWDLIEQELFQRGYRHKGFSLREMLIWLFLSINFKKANYRDFEALAHDLKKDALSDILTDPNHVPDGSQFSYYFSWLTEMDCMGFFLTLAEMCYDMGIIKPGFLNGDGFFIHSRSSDYKKKKTGTYSDPEAGFCMHAMKVYGIGYTAIVLVAYCGDRWLPVFFKVFPGNDHESLHIWDTLEQFLLYSRFRWRVFVYDTAAHSQEIRDHIKQADLIGVIRSKKNITCEPLLELKEGYFFTEADIPEGCSAQTYLRYFSRRFCTEATFSDIDSGYGQKTMNHQGRANGTKFLANVLSLKLMKAIAAFKVNRGNLMLKSTAFQQLEFA